MTELQNKAYFVECKPILKVKDVSSSLDYYCNKLGFSKVFSWKDGVGFCNIGKLDFAEVKRGSANIMLSSREYVDNGTWVYLYLDSVTELESLYQEFKESGSLVVEPPNDKPWNAREILVKDLDENFLRIGSPSSD